MHMWQANTRMVLRWSITRLDSTFVPVARSATYNSRLTRRTIDWQCTSTMDLTTISHSSWYSSHRWTKTTEIWKSFPLPRAKRCRLNSMVFNSKTHWNWSAVLSSQSWLRHLRTMTWNTTNIPRLNSDTIVRNGVNSGVTNNLFVDMEGTHILHSYQIILILELYPHTLLRAVLWLYEGWDDATE